MLKGRQMTRSRPLEASAGGRCGSLRSSLQQFGERTPMGRNSRSGPWSRTSVMGGCMCASDATSNRVRIFPWLFGSLLQRVRLSSLRRWRSMEKCCAPSHSLMARTGWRSSFTNDVFYDALSSSLNVSLPERSGCQLSGFDSQRAT
jgi:hypothetical protein